MFFHIDMDYFFAQIEEVRNPGIRNNVVVVCVFSGRTKDSGVVSTVNYEGRKYGIKSGIPIVNAKRLAPQESLFLPMDRAQYEIVSEKINTVIKSFYPNSSSQASIDEWNCEDSNQLIKNELLEVGKKIKEKIKKETHLSCTIGIAPSLLGAKICAAKHKPNGLGYLDKNEERDLIDELDVVEVPGIGKVTQTALNEMGVNKVKEIQKISPIDLVEVFGRKLGANLQDLGNGKYQSELEEEKESDGISRIGTLKELTRDKVQIENKIAELKKDIVEYLTEKKKMYKTVSLIFITEDMKTHTKSQSFRNPKSVTSNIESEITKLSDLFLVENSHQIRRVGIKFSSLVDMKGQTTLF